MSHTHRFCHDEDATIPGSTDSVQDIFRRVSDPGPHQSPTTAPQRCFSNEEKVPLGPKCAYRSPVHTVTSSILVRHERIMTAASDARSWIWIHDAKEICRVYESERGNNECLCLS